MRVLIVSWEFPPVVVGGLGRHVGELAPALAALGHDVRVLTRGRDRQPSIEQLAGVTVYRAAADGLDIDLASESVLAWAQAFEHSLVRAGLTALDGWQPQLIHAHDWLVGQTAVTLHQVSGAPLVLTMHATEHGRRQGWLAEPVARAIHSVERWLCGQATLVIACSAFMAGELRMLYGLPADRLRVIGNGVRLPEPEPAVSEPAVGEPAWTAEWPAGSGPVIAFAGRLVHEKGVQELIKALPLLRPEFPGLRAVIAGTGEQLAAQRDRAERYRVAELISWPGFLDQAGLHRLFRSADVVVVPSVYEPFGLVALEAQLAGTPVAVADTGGLAELVEPGATGVRFDCQDPAALAAAVAGLLRDPAGAARMAATAQQRARTGFSWDEVARQTAAVYQAALAGQSIPLP
ncbi:MAG TPA: glycosyltransferase family 4 protein [Jatrophihabitans sp.]|nr:glycosyltransferase family 4 protein [Jatrophihabitans sp.]